MQRLISEVKNAFGSQRAVSYISCLQVNYNLYSAHTTSLCAFFVSFLLFQVYISSGPTRGVRTVFPVLRYELVPVLGLLRDHRDFLSSIDRCAVTQQTNKQRTPVVYDFGLRLGLWVC